MTLAQSLSSGRAAAEANMRDACSITRSGGVPVWDPAVNDYVTPTPVAVYAGRCKVKAPRTAVSSVEAGERQVTLVPGEVHIPVASIDYGTDPATGRAFVPTDDDTVTVTALGSASDPALLDRVFSVTGTHIGSSTTARRLPVKAVV